MTTHLSQKDLRRLRLSAHLLAGARAVTVEEVAARMLAVQAQDLAHAGWALGVRTESGTAADVASSFARGRLVRTWPMRGTLHVVDPSELGWMLALTTPRMLARTATRRRQLELDDAALGRAGEIAVAELAGDRSLSRSGFMAALEIGGISTAGQRGYHIIYHLAQVGLLVWGPPEGTQQALVLRHEWIADERDLTGDAALAEFLVRYLQGHGPATLNDFAWWSSLTLGDAKRGMQEAGGRIVELEYDGRRYFADRPTIDSARPAIAARDAVHALAGFDEYVLGYHDRSPVLDAEFADRIVPGNNGIFQPAIVSRGRVSGTWRRTRSAAGVSVAASPFSAQTAAEDKGFAASARRYTRFLGAAS